MQRYDISDAALPVQRLAITPRQAPLLARFIGKFVLDILPAALASVIGGFLFSQYQFRAAPPRPPAEQIAPATAEMMQLVRDEHAAIIDFLKTESTAEKSRLAAEDSDAARAAADAKAALTAKLANEAALAAKLANEAASAQPRRQAVAAATPKVNAVRMKPVIVTASAPLEGQTQTAASAAAAHPPLVIAQSDPTDAAAAASNGQHDPDSLLAKTIAIKDDVLHATFHVVSAIGGIPSWIAGMGDRLGGDRQGDRIGSDGAPANAAPPDAGTVRFSAS